MAIESYLLGLTGFLVFVVLFIALRRLNLPIGWFVLEILLGIFIHFLSTMAGLLWVHGFSYWYHTSLYAFLWFCFFFVSSIYSVSVSVGIISYLYEKPDHVASLSEIYQQCVVAPFEERAKFLVDTKQAQKIEQCYAVTHSGKQTARRLHLVQKVLGMESHGFYAMAQDLVDKEESGEIENKPKS